MSEAGAEFVPLVPSGPPEVGLAARKRRWDEPATASEITELLHNWSDGAAGALDDLMPLVFDDLRRMASRYLRHERFLTLQSTALVNEVFLKLLQRNSLSWKNRLQFYGFVATEMRRILVDRARKRKADRRGGGQQPLTIDVAVELAAERNIDLQALDEALADLANLDPELSQVVELRFFVGLSHAEVAEVQGTSVATVRRRWESARTWLYRELRSAKTVPPADSRVPTHEAPEGGLICETTRNLRPADSAPLFFHREVRITFTKKGDRVKCRLVDLDVEAEAPTLEEARSQVSHTVRALVASFTRQMTHTLTPEQRSRKRAVLGLVDLPASGLLRETAKHAWVIGHFTKDSEGVVFRALGNQNVSYPIDKEFRKEISSDDHLRFAKVRTGKAGEPAGPVVGVEEPLTDEQENIWIDWQNRTQKNV